MQSLRDLIPDDYSNAETSEQASPLTANTTNPSSPSSKLQGKSSTESIWDAACQILANELDEQICSAWIKPLKIISFSDDTGSGKSKANISVTFAARNKFCCEHISKNYTEPIANALSAQFGSAEVVLNFRVDSEENTTAQAPRASKRRVRSNQSSSKSTSLVTRSADESNLNPNYNFSNLVVGGCNQFAHAVSLQVSENLGTTYNPLFIYGGVGLGKTHLANAIGNSARRRKKKVLLVSSETFVSELIASLRSNTMTKFKSKFRSLDVLVIDDIQFLIGKERTQEEFFHTFNELHNQRKQIVITSDKLPHELVGLEKRLQTRFASGVSVDLQTPDYETRIAILSKKAENYALQLPTDVASLLSEAIDTNVRELEGALNRLRALCAMHNSSPTLELAQEVVNSVRPNSKKDVTTDTIQRAIAAKFNVSLQDMLGKRRTHNIAFARQVAMYLSREHTGCSYPELGALFGGRDHSTVIHANKVVKEKMAKDKEFREDIRAIEANLLR